ncbi:MAG: ribbon-helix-helix protein, CopG family [Thermomicrobiales bacterium]
MHEPTVNRAPLSVRLTDDAHHLLSDLATSLGVSKSAVIEMAIREKARREYESDAWGYTPQMRARIERARQSRDVPGVTEEDLQAIAAADDPASAARQLIARRLDG